MNEEYVKKMVEVCIDGITTTHVNRYTFYTEELYDQFLERGALPSEMEHQIREFENTMNTSLAFTMTDSKTGLIIGPRSNIVNDVRARYEYDHLYIPGATGWVMIDGSKYNAMKGFIRIIPLNMDLIHTPPLFHVLDVTTANQYANQMLNLYNSNENERNPWFTWLYG